MHTRLDVHAHVVEALQALLRNILHDDVVLKREEEVRRMCVCDNKCKRGERNKN